MVKALKYFYVEAIEIFATFRSSIKTENSFRGDILKSNNFSGIC